MPEFPENPPPLPRFKPPELPQPVKTRVYGVPRRYGLDTILVVVTLFAVLFGLLTWTGLHPVLIGLFVLFIAGVGVSQAVFFGGKNPRLASVLGGLAMWILIGIGAVAVASYRSGDRWPRPEDFFCLLFGGVWFSPLLGYVAGTFVAGVFMILEWVEQLLRTHRGQGGPRNLESRDADPFGPQDRDAHG